MVYASLPGASPETMASSVATPLEKQFSTIAGIQSMSSASYQGVSNITLQFDLNRNIDAAAQDVQSAIAAAQPQLPHEMPSPPTFRKVNPAEQAIMYLGFSSQTLPLSEVDRWAETDLAQRISMVSGVAQVQVYGSKKYAVRIQLDPKLLASARHRYRRGFRRRSRTPTSTCPPARCTASIAPTRFRPPDSSPTRPPIGR